MPDRPGRGSVLKLKKAQAGATNSTERVFLEGLGRVSSSGNKLQKDEVPRRALGLVAKESLGKERSQPKQPHAHREGVFGQNLQKPTKHNKLPMS